MSDCALPPPPCAGFGASSNEPPVSARKRPKLPSGRDSNPSEYGSGNGLATPVLCEDSKLPCVALEMVETVTMESRSTTTVALYSQPAT